jgi:hypothetical protein
MAIAIPSTEPGAARRRLIRRRAPAAIALIPAALTVIIVYLG